VIPNERSSHTQPTVRGGGLVIVLICLTSYAFYTIYFGRDFQIGYLIGAVLIAFISWLDDLYSISFVWRFLIHAASAVLVVSTIGYFQEFYVPFFSVINIGLFGSVLTFVWIVWLTNAYNFMDGIDGIAGMQALTAGIGWLLIGKINNFDSAGFYGGVIAFSSLGFLIQNWQPAKIFMGDVGSAFLGYSFAVLPLLAKSDAVEKSGKYQFLPIASLFLVWFFVFDTVVTFMRRLFNGEKVWEAHRSHLYQRMNIGGLSHQTVTIIYGAISLTIVCLTIIWMSGNKFVEIILALLIAFQSLGLFVYTQFKVKTRTN
jgi:UDP-N-acetylmuramyl pentapeptide phosphotransferase/UDP-N-acetylglucosamine-1-phosphate transferase